MSVRDRERALGASNPDGADDTVTDPQEHDEVKPSGFSRRRLLAAGVGLAAAACSTESEDDPAAAEGGSTLDKVRDAVRVVGRVDGERSSAEAIYFQQPSDMPVTTRAKEKVVQLTVDYMHHTFAKRDGTVVSGTVRAYNNHVPGPTLRCDPGDKLTINLKNNLPAGEKFTYDYEGCKTVDGDLSPAEAGLPHAFNTTNLHTHGLHVSPSSLCDGKECGDPPYKTPPTLASDDVFVEIPPGGEQDYCIVLPDFHAPGTHWYHAHKHGSTGLQVNNGLLGALIVNEVGDHRILGDQVHEDQIFLMQEIMEVEDGNDQLVYAQERGDSSKFFINGLYQPTLRMNTGEIQRWRFINGTSRPRGLTKLRLVKEGEEQLRDTSDLPLPSEHAINLERLSGVREKVQEATSKLSERVRSFQRIAGETAQPMYLIAVDGISFYGKAPREVLGWDFAPGNRADFLVKVSEPGRYRVVKDVHPYAEGGPLAPEVQTLAFIEVSEGSGDMQMPATIPGTPPCYLDPISSTSAEKTVDFAGSAPNNWDTVCPDVPVPWLCAGSEVVCDGVTRDCNAPDTTALLPRAFVIDCERFDPDVVEAKYTVELNSAEEWTLRNHDGGAHPFHIHVNPFQVVEIFDAGTGQTTTFDSDDALWQDVVAIPKPNGNTASYVKIRQRFLNYPGNFVIHCHFLNHEDLGMMKRVKVARTNSAKGHGPCKAVAVCSKG